MLVVPSLPVLAKVGVEGSNPFASSKISLENQSVEAVLQDRFLLPRPSGHIRGSRGKQPEAKTRRFPAVSGMVSG